MSDGKIKTIDLSVVDDGQKPEKGLETTVSHTFDEGSEESLRGVTLVFSARIEFLKAVVPAEGYPVLDRTIPPEAEVKAERYNTYGLFGELHYAVKSQTGEEVASASMSTRLAHAHYVYKDKPVYNDTGKAQYDHLYSSVIEEMKSMYGNRIFLPPKCRAETLFPKLNIGLMKIAKKYLELNKTE